MLQLYTAGLDILVFLLWFGTLLGGFSFHFVCIAVYLGKFLICLENIRKSMRKEERRRNEENGRKTGKVER